MIVASRSQFETICQQRGYDLAAAMACVVSQDGDRWTIDETHAAYPRMPATRHRTPGCAAGSELKRMLHDWFGVRASSGCPCDSRAAEMDRNGCEWCEANLDLIVGWLREEAGRRKLPFLNAAARLLVRRAISNARRKFDET